MISNSQSQKVFNYHLIDFNSIEEICLIDDDPAIIFLNRMILKNTHPHIVIHSFDGIKDAFIHLQNQQTLNRLLILDINIGLTTGFDLLDMLSMRKIIGISVVMHSSCTDRANVDKAFSYTLVKAYIEKPLTIEIVELISGKIPSIELNTTGLKSAIFSRVPYAQVL